MLHVRVTEALADASQQASTTIAGLEADLATLSSTSTLSSLSSLSSRVRAALDEARSRLLSAHAAVRTAQHEGSPLPPHPEASLQHLSAQLDKAYAHGDALAARLASVWDGVDSPNAETALSEDGKASLGVEDAAREEAEDVVGRLLAGWSPLVDAYGTMPEAWDALDEDVQADIQLRSARVRALVQDVAALAKQRALALRAKNDIEAAANSLKRDALALLRDIKMDLLALQIDPFILSVQRAAARSPSRSPAKSHSPQSSPQSHNNSASSSSESSLFDGGSVILPPNHDHDASTSIIREDDSIVTVVPRSETLRPGHERFPSAQIAASLPFSFYVVESPPPSVPTPDPELSDDDNLRVNEPCSRSESGDSGSSEDSGSEHSDLSAPGVLYSDYREFVKWKRARARGDSQLSSSFYSTEYYSLPSDEDEVYSYSYYAYELVGRTVPEGGHDAEDQATTGVAGPPHPPRAVAESQTQTDLDGSGIALWAEGDSSEWDDSHRSLQNAPSWKSDRSRSRRRPPHVETEAMRSFHLAKSPSPPPLPTSGHAHHDNGGEDSGYYSSSSSSHVIAELFAPVIPSKKNRATDYSRKPKKSHKSHKSHKSDGSKKRRKKKKKKKKKKKDKAKGGEHVVPTVMRAPTGDSLPSPLRIWTMSAMAPILPALAMWMLQPDERDISDIRHGIAVDEKRDLPRIPYFSGGQASSAQPSNHSTDPRPSDHTTHPHPSDHTTDPRPSDHTADPRPSDQPSFAPVPVPVPRRGASSSHPQSQ